MTRLTRAALADIPEEARPRVSGAPAVGIVHLGLGAFHRAHQAVYTEDAIAAAGGDWGIAAVAPRSREVLDQLAAQDGLYSVLTVRDDAATGGVSVTPRVVGVVSELLHLAGDPETVLRRLADPATHVVTLTVTEKAYLRDPGNGGLTTDPATRSALAAQARGDAPATAIPTLLARAIALRARGGAGPLTVVSCDNLPQNGVTTARVVLDAVALVADPAVSAWAAEHVRFPSTMVDRIVPATTPSTRELAATALGVVDHAPVSTEPFTQWVVEDSFAGPRPRWEAAGATMVSDVAQWERLKLRILNGTHSALAYLGALAGERTIADVLALPGAEGFARHLAAEAAPTLDPPDGTDVAGYAESVLARFADRAMGHTTLQICKDGSQKLPQRLFGTIADLRAGGAMPQAAVIALAAWLVFVRGSGDDGGSLPLDDPSGAELRDAVAARPDTPAGLVDAVFGVPGLFPPSLVEDGPLRDETAQAVSALRRLGVRAVLAAHPAD